MDYDFYVYEDVSICLLSPQTEAAHTWIDEHLSEDTPVMGKAVAVERRFIHNLCTAILDYGLSIEKNGKEMFVGEDNNLYLRPKSSDLTLVASC